MKKLFVILFVLLLGCTPGTTTQKLTGYEPTLPPELQGLKVYTVQTGGLSEVKVAILNGQVNSVTYPVGKTQQTTIMVNGQSPRTINCEIISETKEIIVLRKK